MMKNLRVILKALFLCLIAFQQAIAQKPPAGVLALRPEGYAIADYPDVFDNAEEDGITIEAWFLLTDTPKDWERWVLFAKPGSYEVIIRGRDLGSGLEQRLPEGTVYVAYITYTHCSPKRASWGGHLLEFPPKKFPLNRWIHIAFHIRENTRSVFFDGQSVGSGGMDLPMSRSDSPLLIGGSKSMEINGGYPWGDGYSSLKGWIDEIRISNKLRKDLIKPPKRFQADAHTIALWHFDEGPGAVRYADASGNGYTLFASGTLAVEAQGKLATTWGNLKQSNLKAAQPTEGL
jgi:hypothetical protein